MSDRDDKNRPPVDPEAPATEEEVAASKRLRDALAKNDLGNADVDLARSMKEAWSPGPIDQRMHAEMLDDLPLTPEELRLAHELRDRLEASDEPDSLLDALRFAYAAPAIDEAEHRRIVDEVPTVKEIELAEELRVGLEKGATQEAILDVLRLTYAPKPIDEQEHRALVARVLERGGAKVLPFRPRLVRVVAITTTSVVAFAASIVLWITTAPAPEAPLARVRSTQPLFGEPFRAGENTTARIDTIAIARASDYRDNRFAKWGVR